MSERGRTNPPASFLRPLGTVPATRWPGDVRVGDYLFLAGSYRMVRDMRSDGTAERRVLIFSDHPPVVMDRATTTYRRVEYR